jgi:hypothetical protein
MFDGVKGFFVNAVGDCRDPKSIPGHYVRYYDKAVDLFRKFGSYTGVDDIPEQYWPVVCLLGDLAKRNDELEARIALLEQNEALAEADRARPSVDLRTKEGRVWKAQQAGVQ